MSSKQAANTTATKPAKAPKLAKTAKAPATEVVIERAPAAKPSKAPARGARMAELAAKAADAKPGTATAQLRALFATLPAKATGTDAVEAAVAQGFNASSARKAFTLYRKSLALN